MSVFIFLFIIFVVVVVGWKICNVVTNGIRFTPELDALAPFCI